jgi:protein ImuB
MTYACLYAPEADEGALVELAGRFSPIVERTGPGMVVFSIAGLGRLIGGVREVAAEIARRAEEVRVCGQLAIAANPDAAVLAARNLPGVTILEPGREADELSGIPVGALPAEAETLATLGHWGVRTLGDLAALPGLGLIERFGEEGERLRRLALGQSSRALAALAPEEEFAAEAELEHAVELLEPLLFILNSLLREALRKLASYGLAANQVTLELNGNMRRLEFPVPVSDAAALLKQVQLDLEAHPAGEAVRRVRIELRPAEKRGRQGGFFTPPAPEPEKLQTVLARVAALVGAQNVGSPELLDTHRPDAYVMRRFTEVFDQSFEGRSAPKLSAVEPQGLMRSAHLALRRYRPVATARVQMEQGRPARVESAAVGGRVAASAGPWKSSGDWWGDERWTREEWDVALSDGGLYRIYCAWSNWFIDGEYD